MFDKLKNTIYSIYAGIDDGWQYPHHINYKHDLYVNVMHVAQVSRLAYEVYKSGGHLSYREVKPFSVKPSLNQKNIVWQLDDVVVQKNGLIKNKGQN